MNGIGDKIAGDLSVMGIYTIEDLLNYFPFRYDVFEVIPLRDCVHDDHVTIMGTVINEPSLNFYGRRKSRLTLTIEIERIAVKVVMFNRDRKSTRLNSSHVLTITGKWSAHRVQITRSDYQIIQPDDQAEMKPIYSVKGDIKNPRLKN